MNKDSLENNQEQRDIKYYAQDVDYPSGFIVDQTPMRLSYVAALNDHLPPDPAIPFTYCELGCSTGVTLNTLAAANPDSSFYGIDINSESISKASQVASDAGLGNVVYEAKSFDGLMTSDFPEFDYITMHGTYSWLPPETVRSVITFLDKKLKNGGLFYLEFMLLPALSSAEPVARLMRELTSHMQSSSQERAEYALEKAISFCRNKTDFFERNPYAVTTVAGLDKERKANPHWATNIAHAQLSGSWAPKYVTDVADELGEAGLTRAGSTLLPLNDINLSVPPEQLHMLEGIDDPLVLELVTDYLQYRVIRQDVYIKHQTKSPAGARDFLYNNVYITPRTATADLNLTVKIPGRGEIPLQGQAYKPMLRSLSYTGTRIGELTGKQRLPDLSEEQAFTTASHLIASGKVFLCMKPCKHAGTIDESTTFTIPLTYNRYVLSRLDSQLREITLANTVTGSGITVPVLEALLLHLLIKHGFSGLKEKAFKRLKNDDTLLQISNTKVEAFSVTDTMFNESLAVLVQRRLPNLVRMGSIVIAQGI